MNQYITGPEPDRVTLAGIITAMTSYDQGDTYIGNLLSTTGRKKREIRFEVSRVNIDESFVYHNKYVDLIGVWVKRTQMMGRGRSYERKVLRVMEIRVVDPSPHQAL